MKALSIMIILCMSLYSSESIVIGEPYYTDGGYEYQDYVIQGNGEDCLFSVDLTDNVILNETCIKHINSKGLKIFCTKNKTVCKTLNELNSLIKLNQVEKNDDSNIDKTSSISDKDSLSEENKKLEELRTNPTKLKAFIQKINNEIVDDYVCVFGGNTTFSSDGTVKNDIDITGKWELQRYIQENEYVIRIKWDTGNNTKYIYKNNSLYFGEKVFCKK